MRRNLDLAKYLSRFPKLRDQAGMTLIEIMIVIAIIGGLLAVMGNIATKSLNRSRVETAKIQLKEIGKALDSYNLSCNSYPTTEQGFKALMENPGPDVCANWGPEPYINKLPRDPWNHQFVYESDGSTMDVKSLGRDGKEGGEGYDKDLSLRELEN